MPELNDWQHRVSARWNDRAAWWDEMSEANAAANDRRADLDRTLAALNVAPGDRILDAGCGSGQFAIAFAERGFRVTGIDIAPAMIERARAHAASRNVAVDWHVGDYAELRPGDNPPFEAIHARMSLQFVENIPRVLQLLPRLLRPDGRLYASVPGAQSPIYGAMWRRFLGPDAGMHYLAPWDLERLLEHFGWEVADQWGDLDSARVNAISGLAPDDRLRAAQTLSTTWAIVCRPAAAS